MKFSTISSLFVATAVPAFGGLLSRAVTPNYLFVFGDSYTTTGFNVSLSWPSTSNPIGNPAYPGAPTTGNGPNWAGYLTETYNKSLIYTFDFAVGGATTNNSIVKSSRSTILDQIQNKFIPALGKHPAKAPWQSSNSYFITFIGINEDADRVARSIGGAYERSGVDYNALTMELQDSYMKLMGELYNVGARNFLFMTIPPLQYSPTIVAKGTGSLRRYRTFVDTYNAALPGRVASFRAAHSGVKTLVFDNHGFWVKVLAHPTAYGFRDNTTIDAGGNYPYIWRNGYHPGYAFNKILAKNVSLALHADGSSWW